MKKKEKSKLLIQIVKFFFPVILGLIVVIVVGFLLEENFSIKFWSLITAYFFPPLGKESVIPTGVLIFHINAVLIALSIAFVDIIVALFLLWNYDLAKKIPLVGKFMVRIEEKGKNFEKKYRWVKPLRFIGIVLFVVIPFQGSGGLVGSIVGRLIGMKPWNTFFAISIGAIAGCLLIAAFAESFKIFAEINTMLTLILVAIIAIVVLTYFLIKHRKSKKSQKK